jgi:hypothetical protein
MAWLYALDGNAEPQPGSARSTAGHIDVLCVTFIGAAGQPLAWIDHAIYAARTAPRQEGNSNAR